MLYVVYVVCECKLKTTLEISKGLSMSLFVSVSIVNFNDESFFWRPPDVHEIVEVTLVL